MAAQRLLEAGRWAEKLYASQPFFSSICMLRITERYQGYPDP